MTSPTTAIVQKRNAEMTALASADLLSVDDKNVAFEIYDATGGASFSLDIPATVALDTLSFPDHFPEVFSYASNIVTLQEYGLYTFYGRTTGQQAGGQSIGGLKVWVEEDPNTGVWGVLTASETFFTIPSINAAKATGSFTFTKMSAPGFRYRMRISQIYGSGIFSTVALQSSLGIIRLFKTG